ncbi:MAG: cytochrome c [Thiohalomonadales bacterium]
MMRIYCIVGIAFGLLLEPVAIAKEDVNEDTSDAVEVEIDTQKSDKSDIEQAVILSNSCSNCHGLTGSYISIGPNISHYKTHELEIALKAFRDGTRPSSNLSRQAKLYTDAEIRLISDYIGN